MQDGDIINYSTFHSLLMVSTVDVVVGILYFVRLPSFARRKRVCSVGRSAKAKLAFPLQRARHPRWVGKICKNHRV